MKQPQTRTYSRRQGMGVECNALALPAVKLYGRTEAEVPGERQAEETGGRLKKKSWVLLIMRHFLKMKDC